MWLTMERDRQQLALCFGLFTVALSGSWGVEGMPSAIQWTQGAIHCPHSLVVIEEAFHTVPSPEVCDDKCRTGPEATHEDECYHRNGACVQGARTEEVALLYDTCMPASAPVLCNVSAAAVPATLHVGYSCLEGNVFDPYNQTFSWKAKKVSLAFKGNTTTTPTTLITRCKVTSDSTQPSLKITALKSPSSARRDVLNMTSQTNDITVILGDVVTSIRESRFPHWWIVEEPRFEIELTMEVTGPNSMQPHWISLEDDHMIEIVCRHLDVTALPMTSPMPTAYTVPPAVTGKGFSLQDLVVAVTCTVVVILGLALAGCLIVKCRRRRRQRERDYSNLIARVEFHNQGADSCVAAHPACCDINTEASFRGPCPPPPHTYPNLNGYRGGGDAFSNAIANTTYGMCSTSADVPLHPSLQHKAGCHVEDDGKYETPRPLVVQLPQLKGQGACGGDGGDGGFGEECWWPEGLVGGKGLTESNPYDEIPALCGGDGGGGEGKREKKELWE
ncbi:uncharacterized protein LOC143291708 [Babylonia areolata]|uniref:uncharacterized protein LOC143291708 n=1 Tax=Babylonia areolata TaxID=304850 RepID=UPI003FCEFF9C